MRYGSKWGIFLGVLLWASSIEGAYSETKLMCRGSHPDGSLVQFELKQRSLAEDNVDINLSMTLNATEPTIAELKAEERFEVKKVENEVLFQRLNRGLDFWLIDTNRGSSLKAETLEEDRNYQFYIEKPKEGIERVIVDLRGPASNRVAEIIVHRENVSHGQYLGKFPIVCE